MKRNFKLFCLVALAAVMLSLLCITVSAADSEIVLGDINGDSVVDINDAIYLLKHTMAPSRYPVSQPADVNGTGDVNIDDAIYLLKHTMMPSKYPIIDPTFCSHKFIQQNTEVAYLKSAASCNSPAIYYYSCICGEAGETTFAVGNTLKHDFGNWIVLEEVTSAQNGLKERVCQNCNAIEQINFLRCSTCYGEGYESFFSGCCTSGRVQSTCYRCAGSGKINDPIVCSICNGVGSYVDGFGTTRKCGCNNGRVYPTCSRCNGAGYTMVTCPSCNGIPSHKKCSECDGQGHYDYILLKYNLNGGDGHVEDSVFSGNYCIIANTIPTKNGYVFLGWKDIKDNALYKAGRKYSGDSTELYAVWLPICSTCNGEGRSYSEFVCTKCNGNYVSTSTTKKCNSCGGTYIVGSTTGFGGTTYYCYTCLSQDVSITTNTHTCSCGDGKVVTIIPCSACDENGYIGKVSDCEINIIEHIHDYQFHEQKNVTWSEIGWNEYYTCDGCGFSGHVEIPAIKDVLIEKNISEAGSVDISVNPNNSLTIKAISNVGYTFLGWYKGDVLISTTDTYTFTPHKYNKEIAAKWKINNYSISVTQNILEGGNVSMGGSYDFGSLVTVIATTNTGYEFLGWYENDVLISSSENYTFNVVENKNLCARWSLGCYTITYECANDVNIENMPSTYTIKDDNFSLNRQSKEHYTFCWKIDNKVVDVFDTSIAKDVVVKGVWTPIEYQITYDLDGGTGWNRTTHNITTWEFSLNQPTKDGCTFIGWTGSNGTVPEIDVIIPEGNTENLSYKANWIINIYSITYVLFDGKNHAKNPDSYSIGDTIELKDASKDGYCFEGWYSEPEFINRITTLSEQHVDLILYAKFAPLTYSATFEDVSYIKYNLHLHYWENSNHNTTMSYKSGDSIDLYSFEMPEREGYFFGGWFLDSNLTVSVGLNKCFYGDVTLYAKWYEKENFVSYGQIYDTRNNNNLNFYTEGEPFELIKNISMEANGFGDRDDDGYSSEKYCNYFYVPYTYSGEVTISYSVSAGGTYQDKVGTAQAYLYDVTTGTYIFNVSKSGSRSSVSKTLTFTLEAGHYYRIYCYAKGVSYSTYSGYGSGSGYASVEITGVKKLSQKTIFSNIIPVIFDEKIATPYVSREGYDFIGWYDENGNQMTDNWVYTSDQTFYADWKIHEYSIQYVLNEGENDSQNPLTFVSNDNIELKSPQKTGYAFDGWYSDSVCENEITFIDGRICTDITLYAKWIPNTYVANLDYCGGENSPTIRFFSNEILIKSVDLYKDSVLDYFILEGNNESTVFAGWYLNSDFTQAFDFNGIINKDIDLYAKWISIADTYSELGKSVSVKIVGKTEHLIEIVPLISQTIEINSLSALDLFGVIYDENMNAITSSDDISDDNLNFSIQIALQAGHKYYLSYRANQNSVSGEATLHIGGVQYPSAQIVGDYTAIIENVEVAYDSSFVLPTPKKEGYEFVGWFDQNGKMIDCDKWKYVSNMTIYAYWESQEQ